MYDKLIRHKSTSDGELRRLIELRISRPMDVSKAESDEVFRELSQHYGLAGPKFVQYVMNNREEVDEIVRRFAERLDADLRFDQSDRFHAKTFTLGLAGGYIARKIGLIDIPLQPVYEVAVQHMRGIKTEVLQPVSDSSKTATETLGTFVNENIQNALVINTIRTNGIPHPALQLPRGPLRMRFEPDTKELWVPANVLRDYFVDRQVDFKYAMHEMASMGIAKYNGQTMPKRVGSGALIGLEASSLRCLCFDAEKLGMDVDAFRQPPAPDASSDANP